MAEDYKPVTAQDRANEVGPLLSDLENEKRAKDEGVTAAPYVGYEEALKNYESRSDVETLEQRLAREVGPSFDAAHFARQRGVVLGADDKTLDEDQDSVKAKQESSERVEESEQFKRDQAGHTADEAEDRNESTKLEYPDNDEDK